MIDYSKLTAELAKPAYSALGDVDTANALNAVAGARIAFVDFSQSEFTAAFAPILDLIAHEMDPAKQRKWSWRATMMRTMDRISLVAVAALGHISDFIADGYADAALQGFVSAGKIPAGTTAAQFIGLLSSRPGTAAEVAGIVGLGETLDHLDIAKARGNY